MHASYFHSHPTYPDLHNVPEPSPITLLENPSGNPYPFHTRYGDGTEIPREIITYLRDIYWTHAVGFDWKPGDLLVIDNYCVMHGATCDLLFAAAQESSCHSLPPLTRNLLGAGRRAYTDTPERRRKMYIALTDGDEGS